MSVRPQSARAEFVVREQCISCNSDEFATLDSGKFSEDPVRRFIEEDPWGESPLPVLEGIEWELVRCKSCGQKFHKKILSPEWQKVKFSEWMSGEALREFERVKGLDTPRARFEKGTEFARHVLRIERMTRSIRGGEAIRVLDYGCGWGEFLVMSKLFGFEAYGIERAPARQQFLAQQGVTVFPDPEAAGGAVTRKFHAATLFQVLEHLDEPLDVLRALHGVLVPGGILVLEVPNCKGVDRIRTSSEYYDLHPLEHINCFTPASLRSMAERAGFEAVFPAIAHVTTNPIKVAKSETKRWIGRALSPNTNQYFRRV